MDESYNDLNKVSSLTGLVVPVEVYAKARSDFYEALHWAIQPAERMVGRAPELHGCDFLRDENDGRKFEVFRKIVTLITVNNLKIYRVGYYITERIRKQFATDKKLTGTCWLSLLSMMEPEFEQRAIVPVMDGFDPAITRKFSQMIKGIDEHRSTSLGSSLIIKNSQNIYGEVFYADSQYSVFTQAADVVSYLRHVADLKSEGKSLTKFKKELSTIGDELANCIAWEEVIALNLNGEIQGPKHKAKAPYGRRGPITAAFDVEPSDTEDISAQVNRRYGQTKVARGDTEEQDA